MAAMPDILQQALALQQATVTTPPAPIPTLRLKELDRGAEMPATKPLSRIYDGTSGGNEYEHTDRRVAKAIKFTYALKTYVTDEEIISNLTADADQHETKGNDVSAVRKKIQKMQCEQYNSVSGWKITHLEGEIQWEDFKTTQYNGHRVVKILVIREEGTTDAQHTRNKAIAANLLAKLKASKKTAISNIDDEITNVEEGDEGLFRKFKERQAGSFGDAALQRLKSDEIQRLTDLKTELQAWPQSQFAPGALDEAQQDIGMLGEERHYFGERDSNERKTFYMRFASSMAYLASSNKATVDAYEFIQTIRNSREMRLWKVQQACAIMDKMYCNVIRARLANRMLSHANSINYRVAVPAFISRKNMLAHFEEIRDFWKEYCSDQGVRSGVRPPTFADMLVSQNTSMAKSTRRTQARNHVAPNAGIMAPLPDDFVMNP